MKLILNWSLLWLIYGVENCLAFTVHQDTLKGITLHCIMYIFMILHYFKCIERDIYVSLQCTERFFIK